LFKKKIPYHYDWEVWGNLDYWPTAREALDAGREDCDGQAILAASLLRNRGIDAQVVGNYQHIWVEFRGIGILGPQKEKNITTHKDKTSKKSKTHISLPSINVLLNAWKFMVLNFPFYRQSLLLAFVMFSIYFTLPFSSFTLRNFIFNLTAALIFYFLLVYELETLNHQNPVKKFSDLSLVFFFLCLIFSLTILILPGNKFLQAITRKPIKTNPGED